MHSSARSSPILNLEDLSELRLAWLKTIRRSANRSTITLRISFSFDSPKVRETLTDAAVLNEGAFGKLTGALQGENDQTDELIRIIGQYIYRSRRGRTTAEPHE